MISSGVRGWEEVVPCSDCPPYRDDEPPEYSPMGSEVVWRKRIPLLDGVEYDDPPPSDKRPPVVRRTFM